MKPENLAEILKAMTDYRKELEGISFAFLTAEQKDDYFVILGIERYLKSTERAAA